MNIFILTSQFPEDYETFIFEEVKALSKKYDICVHTLKPSVSTSIPVSVNFWWNPLNWVFFLFFFVIRFFVMIKIGIQLFKGFDSCPLSWERAKSFAVWPLACRLSWKFSKISDLVLFAHWCNVPSTMAWMINQLTPIPYILEIHGENISSIWPNLIVKCEEASGLISCTHFNKARIQKEILSKEIYVCPHGTDIPDLSSKVDLPEEQKLKGLSVGRLVPTKGFSTLIEALGLLNQKHIKFDWTIIGDGPQKEILEQQAKDLGISDDLIFVKRLPHEEVLNHFSGHDLFVLPIEIGPTGDSDGLPNVILEAMAHHCVVISTPVAGVPEVIEDSVTGLLVPPKNHKKLAQAIEVAFANPQLRQDLKTRARDLIVKNYSRHKCLNHLTQTIDSIVSQIQKRYHFS